MLLRVVITKIFPVDPVKPAICQLNSVLAFEAMLRSDFHRKNVLPSRNDELGNVELETVVHSNDSRAVRHFVPVKPDISSIIDALKDERVDIPPGRSCKRCAVPPVLLPEIFRRRQVHAEVQVLVNAIFLEDLKNSGRHSLHGIPLRGIEARLRDERIINADILRRDHAPYALELCEIR